MEKQISKTKIEKRMKVKSNPTLVETIIKLKKTNPEVAKELSKPKRKWATINLKDINVVDGDVIIAGKVLSGGELDSKRKIVAWSFSDKAKEKIENAKGEAVLLTDEMQKNPELNNLKLIS